MGQETNARGQPLKALAALRRSEKQYRRLLDERGKGYVIVLSEHIVLTNAPLTQMLGYAVEEMVGRPWKDFFEPDVKDDQNTLSPLNLPPSVQACVHRPDGKTLTVEMVWRPTIYRKEVAHFILVRDVTHLSHRSIQLQAAAEVSKSTSTLLDPEVLMDRAVHLIQDRFSFYYAGIFLVDVEASGEYAVLRAGTGKAGQAMLQEGHKLVVGGQSMIGWCVANAAARIALDVGQEAVRFVNPHLPETRSEMALPLVSRGRCIGALTVQSKEEAAFTTEDISVLQTMADHLAIAIENARLYEAAQREIAQRIYAEKALSRSKRFLQSTLDALAAQVIILDETGTILAVNASWRRFVRTGALEWAGYGVGRHYLEVYRSISGDFSEHMDLVSSGIQAVITGRREAFKVEYPSLDRTGEIAWFAMRVTRFKEGGPVRVVVAHEDITELKRVEEALRQRNLELALLNRASQVLSSSLDLDQVLINVLEEMRRLLDVAACSVWLIDPETDELVCRHATGPQSQVVRGWRLAPGQGIVNWVARQGQSLIVPDVLADERHFKGVDRKTGLALRSILSVPLRVKEDVIGVLQAVDSDVGRFKTTDKTLLESLAAPAAIMVENARLYEQARQDAETRAMLLMEVNHRVKNNLSMIIGLLYTARRYVGAEDQPFYQAIVGDLINRVRGLAAAHSLLSASEWSPVLLSELADQVIHSTLQSLPRDKWMSVEVSDSKTFVTPDQASHLALVINELVTNSIKYALVDRNTAQINVDIALQNGNVSLQFRDDGPGYPEQMLHLESHNVGFDLIKNIVSKSLHGTVSLFNDNGAVTVVQFQTQVH